MVGGRRVMIGGAVVFGGGSVGLAWRAARRLLAAGVVSAARVLGCLQVWMVVAGWGLAWGGACVGGGVGMAVWWWRGAARLRRRCVDGGPRGGRGEGAEKWPRGAGGERLRRKTREGGRGEVLAEERRGGGSAFLVCGAAARVWGEKVVWR